MAALGAAFMFGTAGVDMRFAKQVKAKTIKPDACK